MKTIFRTVAVAALLLASSCGKDSADASVEQEQQAELLEQTPLEANIVSDNVLIEGATKEIGMPPTPNEAIQFDASESSKMALLSEGFEVSLSSDAAIVGAYIQFKSNDGVAADSYYDIKIEENGGEDEWGKSSKFGRKKNSLSAKVEESTNLDIDFSTAIEPGTFCYDICVYDAEGNISALQEVCVTVESWGGNSELVATWTAIKEDFTEDGITTTTLTGEENCYDMKTFDCNNGQSFEYQNCDQTKFFDIVFKQDGTYEYNSESSSKYLSYTQSDANCEAVFSSSNYSYSSGGNWAYVQADNRLTLVEYTYTEVDNDDTYPGTYQPGEGYLLFDGPVEVNGNSFNLSETYDRSGDDDIVTEKIYFEKK